MNKIVGIFLIFLSVYSDLSADTVNEHRLCPSKDSLVSGDTVLISALYQDGILKLDTLHNDEKRGKLISAMLAFPFPFGFMGAHRVMLGSKPWIPVVYMATFGGCFGILPMIDFCAILLSKDITQFENNPHVFMWLK